RKTPLEDQHTIFARGKFEDGEHGINPLGILEIQTCLHLDGRSALTDDGLVGPLAGQEAQRSEQDALARARFTRDRGETGLELEADLLEQGQIANPKRLQHERTEAQKIRRESSGGFTK